MSEATASQPGWDLRRVELSRRVAQLQWDLGGVAYEMASRAHYRLDVLNRLAAELQEADLEIAEINRARGLADAGAQGACPACGAAHPPASFFCTRCGQALVE